MVGNLSEHFTLAEFTYSDTAKRLGIENKPSDIHLKIMKHTCQYLLEPLRALLKEHFNKKVAINITSGYRCPRLNTAVGGVPTSEHARGSAADIKVTLIDNNGKREILNYNTLYDLIKGWVREGRLSVNQCILEKSGTTMWVHISHHPSGRTVDKKEFLRYKDGSYTLDVKFA